MKKNKPAIPRKWAYIALIANAAIWGSALPIVKPALEFITPFEFLFYRHAIASLVSLPILLVVLFKLKPNLQTVTKIAALEIFGVCIALTLVYTGLTYTSALEASFITNASPVFITIGGILFLKEKEEWHEFVGLVIAVAGITIITLEPFFSNRGQVISSSLLGNLLVMGFSLIVSAYFLLSKKYYQGVSKVLIGLLSSLVASIFFALMLFIFNADKLNPEVIIASLQIPSVLFASVYMGILGSLVAIPLIIFGYQAIEASEATLFTYVQPLFYIPLSILWLKEPFSPLLVLVLGMIAFGVFFAERRRPHAQTGS